MASPSLYGISNSNRDFSDEYYWGKNQFNSSFPIALANYMRDNEKKAILLSLNSDLKVDKLYKSFDLIYNTKLSNSELYFSFESRYEPFSKYVHDELNPIDLVIKSKDNKKFIQPLEIKLTTLPDNTTSELEENKYGSEMVVRTPTIQYMALSIASSLEKEFNRIREIFEPILHNVRDWENKHEIKLKLPDILNVLEIFFKKYQKLEKPLVLQPVWKTIGKSSTLADNCLDVFVWTDFSISRLFMDSAIKSTNSSGISRHQRTAVRLSRFLYEVSKNNKVYQQPIYDGMNYDNKNDKEFAVSGAKTNRYMNCSRLTKPLIHKNEIQKIILGGGQKYLSPERRFDAILYFSKELFE